MKNLSTITILVFTLVFYTAISYAAIKVNPSSAAVGSIVTVTMKGIAVGAPDTMSFLVDFGDGSAPVDSRVYTGQGPKKFTTTHVYSKSGTFSIRGATRYLRGNSTIETRTVTITPDSELPRGRVGEKYYHSLVTNFGSKSIRFKKIGSNLPPGLTLQSNGKISGVPSKEGTYTFTVQVQSKSGATVKQQLTIFIDPSNLIIRATPQMIDSGRAGAGQKITFSVLLPTEPVQQTIRSTRGEFIASGRVIGYVNSPMLINLNTRNPTASERVTVSKNVLQSAKRAGVSIITYRRLFSSHQLGSGTAEMSINIRTAAAGEFRINQMRIFFEQNNRSTIVVDRNTRDLTGVLEIHYNGSGVFKGYWKVGERIIQRVQQNVFYGKVLTLKTPSGIPLPTFSEGAHRLQFIVTEPVAAEQRIEFPVAIYHVQAKNLLPITLLSPENGAEFGLSGQTFSWTEPSLAVTYQVEFLETGQEEPFFTAHVKNGNYILTAKMIELKFSLKREYLWRIRGISEAGDVNSESRERKFTLLP